MADPLSICASAIAVATLAYDGVKTLHDLITGIRDAPKTIQEISVDLGEILKILSFFQEELARAKGQKLSRELEACLTQVQPAMEACRDTCDAFRSKMAAVTSHSSPTHTSFRDRLKLLLQDADIASFKHKLGSYKSTLNIAISFTAMGSTARHVDSVREWENSIEKSVNTIIGQIQGLEMAMATMGDGTGNQRSGAVEAVTTQATSLNSCVQVCVAALDGAAKITGNEAKSIEIRDRAKVAAGVFAKIEAGGAQYAVGNVVAMDDARALVGVASGVDVLAFLK